MKLKALNFKLALKPLFWVCAVMCRFFRNKKEPKMLKKSYEVTCHCGTKYFESYEPPKRYMPCCDDCLPF